MATARRFSFSLLISTLAFAVFAVVAFSGLFPWIEAQFYSPKVVSDLQGRLDSASKGFDDWTASSLERFDKLLADKVFEGVFSREPSRQSLQQRYDAAKLFLLGLQGAGSLRILDATLAEVHFTTEEQDVKQGGDFRVVYRKVADLKSLPDLKAPGLDDGKVHLLPDPAGVSVYLLKPWRDETALVAGFALISLPLEDWRLFLQRSGSPLASQPILWLGSQDFLFSLLGRPADQVVADRVRTLRTQGILPPVQRLAQTDGRLTLALVHKGRLNLLIPSSNLELDPTLKGILLVSFYSVIFLVVFLLANLRGEPLSVVSRKVKRFQLQVVKQYLDLKEQDKIQSLRDELARHSDEIRSDVRKSLGRVRRRDQEWVDRYIDTSWQEVMDLLRGPSPPVESSSNADWKRLETLLQQALTQGRFVVSGPPGPGVRQAAGQASVGDGEDLEEVEELETDEVEELDSLEDETEAVEELLEAEGEAQPLEDLEEVEDLEEGEALEEVEEVGDLEPVEEVPLAGKPGIPDDPDAVFRPRNLEKAGETRTAEPMEPEQDDYEVLEELDAGEMEENDGRISGTLEELVPHDIVASVFHPRSPLESKEPLTVLPSMSEEDGLDMVEELEELEEVSEEGEAIPVGQDFSYPLERLDAVWGAALAEVFDDTGDVVSLKDDVFAEALTADNQDAFGQLVDEVLAGPEGTGFLPLEKEDLVPLHLPREWRWTGAGFDWDRFALGIDEVNLFRALSEIVTELDAFTAAILTEDAGHWKVQSSVGFSDAGKEVLDFNPDSPLTRSFLTIRALHILQGGGSHPVLRTSFHPKDMKFLKAVLCVPLLFRHQPAWLLLGLRHEPSDLLNLLAPRRIG